MSDVYNNLCKLGYSCQDLAEFVKKDTVRSQCNCPVARTEAPGYDLALLILAVAQLILTTLLVFSRKIGKIIRFFIYSSLPFLFNKYNWAALYVRSIDVCFILTPICIGLMISNV